MTVDWKTLGAVATLVGYFALFLWAARAEPDPYEGWPELPEGESGGGWKARIGPVDQDDYEAFALDHDNRTEELDAEPPRAA